MKSFTCCKQNSLLFYGPVCGSQKEVFKIRNIVKMSILMYFMINGVIARHFFIQKEQYIHSFWLELNANLGYHMCVHWVIS